MSKKILIVENDELMIEVMTYILTNSGYEVISITSGTEVFNNIKINHPDLIIMEAILPGINGQEICQLLKLNKATHDLPVILCSDDDAMDETLNEKGAPDDILHKPYDIKCLIDMVEYRLAA
jgi:DNA-binding response OmpR family regulator